MSRNARWSARRNANRNTRAARPTRDVDGGPQTELEDDAHIAGELCYGGERRRISGRTLRLMLWLAAQQQRINEVASDRGQLWITWKGDGPQSIDGEVKTRLSAE